MKSKKKRGRLDLKWTYSATPHTAMISRVGFANLFKAEPCTCVNCRQGGSPTWCGLVEPDGSTKVEFSMYGKVYNKRPPPKPGNRRIFY
jgi:hypothetical protein